MRCFPQPAQAPRSLELTMTLNSKHTFASGASMRIRVPFSFHDSPNLSKSEHVRLPDGWCWQTRQMDLNKVLSNRSNTVRPWRERLIFRRNWVSDCLFEQIAWILSKNEKGHSRKYWSLCILLLSSLLIFLNYERAIIDKRSRWMS